MNSIWTVCTLGVRESFEQRREASPRTWGYYYTEQEAINGLAHLDSEAGYYTHAVIEEFEPGIYCVAKEEKWFVWNESNKVWDSCSKPEKEKHICNYGMG